MLTDTGFLLSYIKYGDHDAVLHAFTKEHGYSPYFLRGIYSKKNKKKPFLFPMRELAFTSAQAKIGALPAITSLELAENRNFETNIKAGAVLFFVADILNQILKNEGASPKMYAHIERFLAELDAHNYVAHLVFLIKITVDSGISPLYNNQRFLNPESGSFQQSISHQLFDAEVSEIFSEIISIENCYSLKIKQDLREKLLDAIIVYYYYHVPEFRQPKTLEIVRQIFE